MSGSLRPLADQGSAKAQFWVGWMYAMGQGVPRDYAQAAFWIRKAADQGDAEAQGELAGMYVHGEGVPEDYAQGAAWYRKAADQGDAFAQDCLGEMYYRGQGVPQDYALSVIWDQGLPLHNTCLAWRMAQAPPEHKPHTVDRANTEKVVHGSMPLALSDGRRAAKPRRHHHHVLAEPNKTL